MIFLSSFCFGDLPAFYPSNIVGPHLIYQITQQRICMSTLGAFKGQLLSTGRKEKTASNPLCSIRPDPTFIINVTTASKRETNNQRKGKERRQTDIFTQGEQAMDLSCPLDKDEKHEENPARRDPLCRRNARDFIPSTCCIHYTKRMLRIKKRRKKRKGKQVGRRKETRGIPLTRRKRKRE